MHCCPEETSVERCQTITLPFTNLAAAGRQSGWSERLFGMGVASEATPRIA